MAKIDKEIINKIKQEQKQLEKIIRRAEKSLDLAPEGSVLVKRYKKGIQFYYRENPEDRNGTYLPVADRERAIALVQKSHDKKILTRAKEQWKVFDTFLSKYDPDVQIAK